MPNIQIDVIVPIVHLNGTSAESLIEQRCDAIDALHNAGKSLAAMSPNGRDYYPEPGLMTKALEQHNKRMAMLRELIAGIEHEVNVIEGQRR